MKLILIIKIKEKKEQLGDLFRLALDSLEK